MANKTWTAISTAMKVGGSILALVPGVGPLVGAAVIGTGMAIGQGGKPSRTADVVSAVSNGVVATQQAAANMNAAGKASLTTTGLLNWITDNLIIVFGAAVILFLLFRKKRR